MTPMEERRRVLAARLLARALALPPTDPLRETAEASAPSRLTVVVQALRTLGRQMLAIRTVDSGAPGCVSLAPRFGLRALRISEEIFLHLVVIHATKIVVNPTLLRLYCAVKRR